MEKTDNIKLNCPNVNDETTETIEAYAENFRLIDKFYPVGCIYQSTVATDPAEFLGGAWSRIEGTFLIGAGAAYPAGTTGGSDKHKHLMPIGFDNNTMFGFYNPTGDTPGFGSIVQSANTKVWGIDGSSTEAAQRIAYTDNAVALPPYKAVYIWERVA